MRSMIKKFATKELLDEIEYFAGIDQEEGEPPVTLAQAYVDACDFFEENHDGSRATKKAIKEIGIALGQWKFITDAEYAGIQVMGGNKSATHPMLRGQRTSLVMNDVKFIEHYGDQV